MHILRVLITLVILGATHTDAKQLLIYHDADYSGHASSAESMAMGLQTALSEVGANIQGYELKLVAKDHRGNVKRSKLHLQRFIEDPAALFVLGGLHSPPYLANKDYINQNEILLMIPWAAAGPITRASDDNNWIFRLSIDDSKAGIKLAEYAIDQKGCKSPHLLLENTGWGKSNLKTITQALESKSKPKHDVTWFEWNTKANTAKQVLHSILDRSSDCIIYVGNAIEGAVFATALASFPKQERIPIISHWGITGGNFHDLYKSELHERVDLSFLQTCFSFNSGALSPQASQVFARAKELYPEKIKDPEDIKAPPGFIHSYDIGKVLIAALKQIELTGDMAKDRANLRDALENISSPVQGLVDRYAPPFSSWKTGDKDAHEALRLKNFCMAEYDEQGIIRLTQ